jgi:adenosylcobinamide-phosphate synthase
VDFGGPPEGDRPSLEEVLSLAEALLFALVLDFLAGDPQFSAHPVRLLGSFAARAEDVCRLLPFPERVQGGFFVGLVLAATLLPVSLITFLFWDAPMGFLVEGLLIWGALGGTSLAREVAAVAAPLAAGDLEAARLRLKMLVSRDVEGMTEEKIASSALETLSENLSDAAVATLLYAALAGPLGAWIHRTLNTLDAMVGYRTPKYAEFGRAAARLDDLLNLLPARLTALLISLAAPSAGGSRADAWRCAREDGPTLESPNAGWPMAALAGALTVSLGGPTSYFGEIREKPVLGLGPRPLPEDLARGLALYWASYALAGALAVGLACLMSR